MNPTYEVILYLISCALNERAVDETKLCHVDFRDVLKAAKSHTVAAMVCMALEKTTMFRELPVDIKKSWIEVKDKAICKNIMLDAAREKLFEEFENRGIWYMPLKGALLKDLYPAYGMREMGDNDILFDSTRREDVKNVFLQNGYEVKSFKEGNHDVYMKALVLKFEMHVSLFSRLYDLEVFRRYEHVKERLLKVENKSFAYRFRLEDFYVFVLAHAYKHYCHSGTGIRRLTDIYVLNQHYANQFNWDYIRHELDALAMTEYESKNRQLANKIFSPDGSSSLTDSEKEMLSYYIDWTSQGAYENRIQCALVKLQQGRKGIPLPTKIKYVLKRAFPNKNWCATSYPFIYKHPILLPVFWIWRILRLLLNISHPMNKTIFKEIKALKNCK